MSQDTLLEHLTAEELGLALRAADPAAFLIEPRILRRVIRIDRQIIGLASAVPRVTGYMISKIRLLECADPLEVGLCTPDDLPNEVLLIERPSDAWLAEVSADSALLVGWRRLFSLRIETALRVEHRRGRLESKALRERITAIGQTEFDEVRGILKTDKQLVPPADDLTVYIALTARYFELLHFAQWTLPLAFPGMRDLAAIEQLLARDVDHPAILATTRLPNAPDPPTEPQVHEPEPWSPELTESPPAEAEVAETNGEPAKPSGLGPALHLERRAERARKRQLFAKAAVFQVAADHASGFVAPHRSVGERPALGSDRAWDDVNRLVQHLRPAVGLSVEDLGAWSDALMPLVDRAASTLDTRCREFWLLDDLQRLIRNHEQQISLIDLVEWILWFGRLPLWRELPQQRPILIAQDLERATRRLPGLRLDDEQRSRLAGLLRQASGKAAARVRDTLRPSVMDAFRVVEFRPRNLPEEVAYHKLVEELLDKLVERGYLSFTHVRDAVGRNGLKIADLGHWTEFWSGDRLLRLDRELAMHLDGVYRRAEVYLRFQHALSSLAFGTTGGRFFMRYLFLPFGGAVAILGFMDYLKDLPKKVSKMLAAKPEDQAADAGPAVEATGELSASPPAADEFAPLIRGVSYQPDSTDVPASETDQPEPDDAPSEAAAPGEATADPEPARDGADDEDLAPGEMPMADAPAEPLDPDQTTSVVQQEDLADFAAALGQDDSPPGLMNPFNIVVFGLLVIILMNMPTVRGYTFAALKRLWGWVWTVGFEWPSTLMGMAIFGEGDVVRITLAVILRPLLVLLPFWGIGYAMGVPGTESPWVFLAAMLFLTATVNSRPARDIEERAREALASAWARFRGVTLAAIINGTLDFFKWISDRVEALIFNVENWLRLRSGDSVLAVLVKPVVGVFWGAATYVFRFFWVVLGEPQVNPVKHFPVVTVSHKIMLPIITVVATGLFEAYPSWGMFIMWTAFFVQLLLPGAAGFLVWELKENWRVYESNRPANLRPTPIGHHGETMVRLLRPGFHSGTIPRIFMKVRRAAEAAVISGDQRPARIQLSHLHEVEHALAAFTRRVLFSYLESSNQWQLTSPRVGEIELSNNRIRIEIEPPRELADRPPLWLHFEEQWGWLVASVDQLGWVADLDDRLRSVFTAAVAGWYKQAGVHLIREQIEANFETDQSRYDIADRGLIVWPSAEYDAEVTYDLTKQWRIAPETRGIGPGRALPVVDARQIVFARTPLSWEKWVRLWSRPIDPTAVQRFLHGIRILPPTGHENPDPRTVEAGVS